MAADRVSYETLAALAEGTLSRDDFDPEAFIAARDIDRIGLVRIADEVARRRVLGFPPDVELPAIFVMGFQLGILTAEHRARA